MCAGLNWVYTGSNASQPLTLTPERQSPADSRGVRLQKTNLFIASRRFSSLSKGVFHTVRDLPAFQFGWLFRQLVIIK